MRRRALAAFWVLAGVVHFVRPKPYEAIVPAYLRRFKREVVIASGVAEVAGGLGVLAQRTRPAARWWLLATLAGVFPANVDMAVHAERFPQIPRWALWARLPLQGLLGWAVWRGAE